MRRLAILLVVLAGIFSSTCCAQQRFALLIGNQAYVDAVGPLKNPHNDIARVGHALSEVGFTVLDPLKDATRDDMLFGVYKLAERLRKAGPGAVGFLYYTGHGIAIGGENVLVPKNVESTTDAELNIRGVRLGEILDVLKNTAPDAVHFVVLDACRNNIRGQKGAKGFAPVNDQRAGVVLAFATAAGETASDEGAGSGPYAAALAEEIVVPGRNDQAVFNAVRSRVVAVTARHQTPWTHDGLIGERVVFKETPSATLAPAHSAGPAAPSRTEVAQFCQSIATNPSMAVVQSLLEIYKGTPMAACTQARLDEMKRAQVTAVVPPPQTTPSTPARPAANVVPAPPAVTSRSPTRFSDGALKIGVLNDLSSLYSSLSGQGSAWAARKAVEDFCKTTKCFEKVDVVVADHQNKPDIGSNVARQWFDVEKVDIIVDVPNSGVALAVSDITKEKNKVLLVSGAATTDLTGKACTPNTVHWTYDTWALSTGTGTYTVKTGGDTWFFLTADYAFGRALDDSTAAVVEKAGGRVIGRARHPLLVGDFSSFLLQAQASKAKMIGLANAGSDTINAVKQASEFGIVKGGQKLAGLLIFISDIHALGLRAANGLLLTEAWYWDANENNRAFAKEFGAANNGNMPTMVQAGVYSAVTHYLKAVHELKNASDGAAVVAKMKSMPTDDKLFGKGAIRPDGRKIHDMYLFEVKTAEESHAPWDYYKLRATIPAAAAFRPIQLGECPLAK